MGEVEAQPQTSFDEDRIDDPEFEALLEKRQELKDAKRDVIKAFNDTDKLAHSKVADLEIPPGVTARCGRFLLSTKKIAASKRSFTTKPSTRIYIKAAKEDQS